MERSLAMSGRSDRLLPCRDESRVRSRATETKRLRRRRVNEPAYGREKIQPPVQPLAAPISLAEQAPHRRKKRNRCVFGGVRADIRRGTGPLWVPTGKDSVPTDSGHSV